MIEDTKIKEIISRVENHIYDEIDVIKRYIYDLMGRDINIIPPDGRIVLSPFGPMTDFDLYFIIRDRAFDYYTLKLLSI